MRNKVEKKKTVQHTRTPKHAFDYEARGGGLLMNFTCWLYLISVGWLIQTCAHKPISNVSEHSSFHICLLVFTHSHSAESLIRSFARTFFELKAIFSFILTKALNLFEWIKFGEFIYRIKLCCVLACQHHRISVLYNISWKSTIQYVCLVIHSACRLLFTHFCFQFLKFLSIE